MANLIYFLSRYFHQPINIFCEFLPQLLFLLAMFGYLNALIFAKWLLFTADDASCAPSLLIGELKHRSPASYNVSIKEF